MTNYPAVKDPSLIGDYPGLVKSGGGYVWDEVLEYRVWCHPHDRAANTDDGDDFYYVFETYEEALAYSQANEGCEKPLALVHYNGTSTVVLVLLVCKTNTTYYIRVSSIIGCIHNHT